MNKLLIGSVALVAVGMGGSAVRAADMPLKAPPPPVVYNWTGCYLGLTAGNSSGRSKWLFDDGSDFTNRFNVSGFLAGIEGGCNYQVSNWVFGIEADASVTNKSGQDFDLANPNFVGQTNERALVTARARLGYTVTSNWLWYVTGGGAWAQVKYSEWNITNPIGAKVEQTDWIGGWTVGAGTEYMLGYGWTIKSEFLYVKFKDHDIFPVAAPGGITCCKTVKLDDYIFRVGMNYKFGWSPAVVAKY